MNARLSADGMALFCGMRDCGYRFGRVHWHDHIFSKLLNYHRESGRPSFASDFEADVARLPVRSVLLRVILPLEWRPDGEGVYRLNRRNKKRAQEGHRIMDRSPWLLAGADIRAHTAELTPPFAIACPQCAFVQTVAPEERLMNFTTWERHR